MTSEAEPSADVVLTDAERLEQLEKAGKLNRWILFGLVGVVLVIVLVTVIVQTVTLMSSKPVDHTLEQIDGLKKQLHSVQADVSDLRDQLLLQDAKIAQMALQKAGNLAGILKPAQDPGTVEQVSKTLLGQEQDFQSVVQSLQLGMRDLAYMLPGSRTWLEYYTETLSKSVTTSKLRSSEIAQWAKSQPPMAEVPVSAAPAAELKR
jgi:cell division protein FtsL